jgi:hypothetical protein
MNQPQTPDNEVARLRELCSSLIAKLDHSPYCRLSPKSRPLPKQEMPLDDELKDIDQYAEKQNNFYTCRVFQSIEYSLHYLRDEIQKLKEAKP